MRICWFYLSYIIAQCTVMDHVKLINAKQAETTYGYKNIREKLQRAHASIWFNKMCLLNHLMPNYIKMKDVY